MHTYFFEKILFLSNFDFKGNWIVFFYKKINNSENQVKFLLKAWEIFCVITCCYFKIKIGFLIFGNQDNFAFLIRCLGDI